jgi:hypothetical protein
MNDKSTISWMIMGGPRYDERSQAELDQQRALQERHLEWTRARSSGWTARFAAFLDGWTARPAKALTADFCAEPCVAA